MRELVREMGSLEQQVQQVNESTLSAIEENYQRAINYSDEQTRIISDRIDKVVSDFRDTLESLQRMVVRQRHNADDDNDEGTGDNEPVAAAVYPANDNVVE